jgi:dCMP deaminase
MRPSFDEIYLNFAQQLSQRSTCSRLQVGCVIVSIDYTQVYAIGYNGNAHGLTNQCDSNEVGNCGCLHAEQNACIHCTTDRHIPKIVYCTHNPCIMCAKSIINLGGVKEVIYKNKYRNTNSLDILRTVGIQTIHYKEA